MLKRFTVDEYKGAFAESLSFEVTPLKENKKRILGASKVVRLELIQNQKNELESAALVFPFFLADKELNRQVSMLALRFLDFCLPFQIVPLAWIEEAKKNVQQGDEDVIRYERAYDGISVMLMYKKDRSMFYLLAERK